MKKTSKAIVVGSLLLIATPALAQTSDNHNRSIADVVNEIMSSQNVNSQADIRCDDVTNQQFEGLGDAVMQAMVGDNEQHEWMDNMMGGEGSESLQAMHIAMGQRYLGCAQGQFGTMGTMGGTIGMMGGMMSMMGGVRGGDGTMMGNFFGPWGMTSMGGAGMLLFWVVVIVGIGLFVAWLSRNQNTGTTSKGALDILKERYAKGEINKEEFESKKKDLSA